MLYRKNIQVSVFSVLMAISLSAFSQTKVVVIPMFGDDAVEVPAPKSVFVTKGLHDGDFGGALGADAICQEEADATDSLVQGTTFKAWMSGPRLSDYTLDGQGFNKSTGPYQLVGGATLWDSYEDLIRSDPAVPISNTADGLVLPDGSKKRVWTGLNNDGTYTSENSHCGGINVQLDQYWTVTSVGTTFFLGAFGLADSTTEWSDSAGIVCTVENRLYCFEQ